MQLGLSLLFVAHRVHQVEQLVIPAQLLLSLWINLSNPSPSSQVPIADEQPGAFHPRTFNCRSTKVHDSLLSRYRAPRPKIVCCHLSEPRSPPTTLPSPYPA